MSDLQKSVDQARDAAWRAARSLSPHLVGPATEVVREARLRTIEKTLAILVASSTPPTAEALTIMDRTLVALRDYWDEVAEEIKS